MMNTDLLSPPFNVVQTSMGTIAMIDIEVIHPTAAMRRTRSGTLGDAYLLNLQQNTRFTHFALDDNYAEYLIMITFLL